MPRLPQSYESQPFPLPILPCPNIPVAGRLAHFVEQWGELTNNKMGPLYRSRRFQDTIQVNSPFFVSSDKSEPPRYYEKRFCNFSRNGQWKGYKIRELPVFIPSYFLSRKKNR